MALPDGATKYIHEIGHPIFDSARNIVEFVGTDMDITERNRAEAEVRDSERRYREVEMELRTRTASRRWGRYRLPSPMKSISPSPRR